MIVVCVLMVLLFFVFVVWCLGVRDMIGDWFDWDIKFYYLIMMFCDCWMMFDVMLLGVVFVVIFLVIVYLVLKIL